MTADRNTGAKSFSAKMLRLAKWLFALAGLLVVATIVLVVNDPGRRAASEHADLCGRPEEAFVYAQEFVEKRLKAPRTASFPSIMEASVVSSECGRWEVRSYVDAQNALGVNLRTPFLAKLRMVRPGVWEQERVELK